jgi:hypothetical protein
MARAVVRYGGGSDPGSKRLRQEIRELLSKAGFTKTGSGSWSGEQMSLSGIFEALEQVAGLIGRSSDASFEQLWIMIDRADERKD